MAGTILGKPGPLILLGSTETNPKHISFSNSHFEVVIYNLKILPLHPQSGGLEYFKNTEGIHFHKRGTVSLPFLLMVVHFGRRGVSDLRKGSAEKTQNPDASRFCYILRRIIIRRYKG